MWAIGGGADTWASPPNENTARSLYGLCIMVFTLGEESHVGSNHSSIFCSFSDYQSAADSNDQQGDLQSFLHFQGRDHVFAL